MIKKIDLSKEDYEKMCNSPYKEFTSTMLDITNERAKNYAPNDIFRNYENKYGYYKPSTSSAIVYNKIENIFYENISNYFDCIEISPVIPFATNSSLTNLSQNMSLSTIRNIEVVSDVSIALSLEAALRRKELIRKKNVFETINLASSARMLRMQQYGGNKEAHWSQHFKALSLLSAFRNTDYAMLDNIKLQLYNWLNVIENLKVSGFDLNNIRVNIAVLPLLKEIYKLYNVDVEETHKNAMNINYNAFSIYNINILDNINTIEDIDNISLQKEMLNTIKKYFSLLNTKIFDDLRLVFPNVQFNFQMNRKSGIDYYQDFCYEILVNCDGKELCLVDGGITNWTGKLLGDSKEKCVSSGMGTEYIAKTYQKKLR